MIISALKLHYGTIKHFIYCKINKVPVDYQSASLIMKASAVIDKVGEDARMRNKHKKKDKPNLEDLQVFVRRVPEDWTKDYTRSPTGNKRRELNEQKD